MEIDADAIVLPRGEWTGLSSILAYQTTRFAEVLASHVFLELANGRLSDGESPSPSYFKEVEKRE